MFLIEARDNDIENVAANDEGGEVARNTILDRENSGQDFFEIT